MRFFLSKRSSGIILHPTSFFGPYGCGDLGESSIETINWLKKAGQNILQILPLGPTGYGDSPYQPFSSFAGTPYIISFDELIKKGYLNKNDIVDYPDSDKKRVNYYSLYINNFKILLKAYTNFVKKIPDDYIEFSNDNNFWLDGYALFMALKDYNNGASWDKWDENYRNYKEIKKLPEEIDDLKEFYKFVQWEFFCQWRKFKDYANKNGITIIGDAPIFVSYDSAEVWANQELFKLDKNGRPLVVAGVPPDYFSETGQLWGNPIYKWNLMKNNNFKWWKKRISHLLKRVDCLRIDHFRGFEAYWEIKYGEKTAVNGKWVKAPGYELFNSLKGEYKDKLPEVIIAEDLGVITDEVIKLRDSFNLPGMKIFEFANFPASDSNLSDDFINLFSNDAYLPDNYTENCIAYPGTHDNDTIIGWFKSLSDRKQNDILNYLKITDKLDLNYAIINSLLESKADRVIFLMQDILKLDSESRMNKPGTLGNHNWSYRVLKEQLTDELAENLYNLTKKSGRI
ncbi:MAG: 4-alpha-glucanotransferase [Spirochaetes bacterium]|nr:4-alpha-glucanotransferase [Spirochaetota bacterium]